MNLTEATILALQGKLVENKIERPRKVSKLKKEESIAIANDDVVVDVNNNVTKVITSNEVVTVENTNEQIVEPVGEVVPEEVAPEEPSIEDVLPEETEIPVEPEEVEDEEIETILDESKTPVTENIEIEVDTEEGCVEVTTTEGEEVEVETVNETEDIEDEEQVEDEVEDEATEEETLPEEETTEEKLNEAKITDYINEKELDNLIKQNSVLKNVMQSYKILDDMLIEVTTEMGVSYYKAVLNDNGELELYWISKDGKKLGDTFLLQENKKVEDIADGGDCTFTLKINCNNDAFGGEGDEETLINEVKRILSDIVNKLTYTDKQNILDSNGNKVGVYGFGFEGVMSPLDEGKHCTKITEDTDIDSEIVSDDIKEEDIEPYMIFKYKDLYIEVDEHNDDEDAWNVQVYKSKEDIINGDSMDSVAIMTKGFIDNLHKYIDENLLEENKETTFNYDTFDKVLTEYFDKEFKTDSIVKEGKDLKIISEGLTLTLTEADSKHNVTKYTLQESKEPMSLITLLKNNELQCKFITK